MVSLGLILCWFCSCIAGLNHPKLDLAAGGERHRLDTQLLGKKNPKPLRLKCTGPQDFYSAEAEICLDTDLPAKAIVEIKVSWGKEGRTMVQRKRQ